MNTNNQQRGLRTWATGLAIAAACLGSAQAQQSGTYFGTTADGHELAIEVALDAGTGQYVISGLNSGFLFNCPKTDDSNEWGLGAWGYNPPVVDGHADFLVRDRTFYLAASIDFKGTDKIVGKVRGGLPEYADELSPPKKGQACNSDNLKFTAKFSPAAARSPLVGKARQATARIDRQGRQVIEHSSTR